MKQLFYAECQFLANLASAIFVQDKTKLTRIGLIDTNPNPPQDFYPTFMPCSIKSTSLKELANYDYDSTKLQSEQALIAAYEADNSSHDQAKGEANEEATDTWEAKQAGVEK